MDTLHELPIGFLSIQAQDFIEERTDALCSLLLLTFLSIQAQDFIEEAETPYARAIFTTIPEHSSSGLH